MALKTLGYDVCIDDIIIDKINIKGYIKHEINERLDDKPDALFHEMIIAYAGIIAEMQILGYPSGVYISPLYQNIYYKLTNIDFILLYLLESVEIFPIIYSSNAIAFFSWISSTLFSLVESVIGND